jgi:hypothetical protein
MTGEPTPRRVIAVSAGFVAAWAWVGAAGLAFGFIGFPARLDHRLPFGSPVVAGITLALVIAVPDTVLTVLAWRGDPRTPAACQACGVVLLAWIAVQLVFLREVSFLHPLLAAVGAGFTYAGRRALSGS